MTIEIFSWIAFNIFVLLMLYIDLRIFHRESHAIGHREAFISSAVWIILALLFCLGLYFVSGTEPALSFLAGFLLEKSLSVDNLFVFLMIFTYFAIPKKYLHKILFWGVLGALVMRAVFIFSGVILIQKFEWMIYLLGALLIYTGIKLALHNGVEVDIEKNFVLRLFRKFFPITDNYNDDAFFIKKSGKYFATPLFVVLLLIETTDILFAIDSVPAILSITKDPFIVYTSNVFAILGLRSLYFALESSMQLFKYLNYGLAILLVFVGIKMLLSHVFPIPVSVVLITIASVLSISIAASVVLTRN